MAIQIYLSDYEAFPAGEHRREVIDQMLVWLAEDHGCESSLQEFRATWTNPFVRWPVVLDEYVRSREAWRCPSAKHDFSSWWIIPSYQGDWFRYLVSTRGRWTTRGCCTSRERSQGGDPCGGHGFPPGWGGTITDSIAQQKGNATPANAGPGCFSQTIGTPALLWGVRASQIEDTANTVVCADAANLLIEFNSPDDVLVELCRRFCGADWENCPWSIPCGNAPDKVDEFWQSPSYRRQFTRHLGGSNLGFADGHAQWWAMEALETATPYCGKDPETGACCVRVTQGRPLGGFCRSYF
jgi:prepilin-type processing-associated H-X9-DG protein